MGSSWSGGNGVVMIEDPARSHFQCNVFLASPGKRALRAEKRAYVCAFRWRMWKGLEADA